MALSMELVVLVTTFLGLLLYFKFLKKSGKSLPPGPTGVPIFGNLLQMLKNPHIKFSKWAEQYGKVYTIHLMGSPAIVINDVKTMKELFSSFASTGKMDSELYSAMYNGKHGLVNSEGEAWQEHYKFCMKTLKQLGFGTGSRLGPMILQECNEICNWIETQIDGSNGGKSVHLSQIFIQTSSNTIWNMSTGLNVRSGENNLVHLIENWIHALTVATNSGMAFISCIAKLAPELSGYNKYMEETKNIKAYMQQHYDACKKSVQMQENKDSSPTNLMEAYIKEVESCTDKNSTLYGEEGTLHGFSSVLSMVIAGSETTASSLNWLIFYLVAYPEVQKKLQEEVDTIVGTEREPTLDDKKSMPYLEAVILEVLRITALVPFGVIHQLLDNVKFEDYVLPKGLLLIPNIYHCNLDPKVWKDPNAFRPERLLEGDEAQRRKVKDCIASFQKGKRVCPGDNFAKDIKFLFAAKLLQKYNFAPEQGRTREEYLEPIAGYLLIAPKIGVKITRRN